MVSCPPATESRHVSSPLLRARDVAECLCLSEATVWRLAREGVLPGVRIAGSTRFRPDDVHALVTRGLLHPKTTRARQARRAPSRRRPGRADMVERNPPRQHGALPGIPARQRLDAGRGDPGGQLRLPLDDGAGEGGAAEGAAGSPTRAREDACGGEGNSSEQVVRPTGGQGMTRDHASSFSSSELARLRWALTADVQESVQESFAVSGSRGAGRMDREVRQRTASLGSHGEGILAPTSP